MLSFRNTALALPRLGNGAINEISIDRRVSSRSDKVRGGTKKLIVRWSIYIPYQDATNLSNVFDWTRTLEVEVKRIERRLNFV